MTADHAFIDASGARDNNMIDGWRQFFTNHPDYRNIFASVTVESNVVIMVGYSTCSNEPRLSGPSMWTARVRGRRTLSGEYIGQTKGERARIEVRLPWFLQTKYSKVRSISNLTSARFGDISTLD